MGKHLLAYQFRQDEPLEKLPFRLGEPLDEATSA
jgi:hypothetical protein